MLTAALLRSDVTIALSEKNVPPEIAFWPLTVTCPETDNSPDALALGVATTAGTMAFAGDLLLHADSEPQHPDEWERWITATSKAIRYQAITIDTGPGTAKQHSALRLIHTHCRRRLPDGTGSRPAALLHP